METREEQPVHAPAPISRTLSGTLMVRRLVQPSNANASIFFTCSGIRISFSCSHPQNIPTEIADSPEGRTALYRSVQQKKAWLQISVTLSETTTSVTPLQRENALSAILLTPSGILTLLLLPHTFPELLP